MNPSSSSQNSLVLSCRGHALAVTARDPELLSWLTEFVCPPFSPAPRRRPRIEVQFEEDPDLYHALASGPANGSWDGFIRDEGPVQLAHRRHDGEVEIAQDPRRRVLYLREDGGRRFRVVTPERNRVARAALMDIARELFMRMLSRRRALVVHAACVAIAGRAIVLVGPRHSGKTSLLIYLASRLRAAYLSNDRVAILSRGRTHDVVGLPTWVNVRAGAFELFPEIASLKHSTPGHPLFSRGSGPPPPRRDDVGRVTVNPGQLCATLGVGAAEAAPLAAFVFPEIVDDGDRRRRFEILPPEAATALLDQSSFVHPNPERDYFRLPLGPSPIGRRIAPTDLGAGVPCLTTRLGPAVYRDARLADQLAGWLDSLDS